MLTLRGALVTTLTLDPGGLARRPIKEASYRLRATHPRFNPEVRTIHVIGGSSSTSEIGKAVDEGVSAVKKIFR